MKNRKNKDYCFSIHLDTAYGADILSKYIKEEKYDLACAMFLPEDKEYVFEQIKQNSLTYVPLFEDEYKLVVSCDNLLLEKKELLTTDLHPFYLAKVGHPGDKITAHFEDFFEASPIELNNKDILLQTIIENNTMIGVLPEYIAKRSFYYRHGLIKILSLTDFLLKSNYYLIYNTDRVSQEQALLLIKQIRQIISKI